MASIQAKLLTAYFWFWRNIIPQPKELNIAKERADLESLAKMFKSSAGLEHQSVDVDGIPGEWITPPDVEDGRVILYLHGGYYLLGSIESHRTLAGNIAAAAHRRTLIIDYRRAPEHTFPAALDDAVTAYHWLLAQGRQPEQVSLVGDSAGGGLVLSVLLALRGKGEALPRSAVCMSPVTDLTLSGESWNTNIRKDLVISRMIARQMPVLYMGGNDLQNPLSSPLFADLHGLPPLLIQVGSDEVLLSDSVVFTEKARDCGVDISLEVWPGMQHIFQYVARFVPESRQAIDRIGEFVKSA